MTSNNMPELVPIPLSETYSTDNELNWIQEHPTKLMEDRFHKWQDIVTGLVIYLKEVAYAQEQSARTNINLQERAINLRCLTDLNHKTNSIYEPIKGTHPTKRPQKTPLIQQHQHDKEQEEQLPQQDASVDDINNSFDCNRRGSALSGFMEFGTGSIQDLQVLLKKYHSSISKHQFKVSKEILQDVLPSLENLAKDLRKYRKEIKLLAVDFKTDVEKHRTSINKLLRKYYNLCKNDYTCSDPCLDPLFIRTQLTKRYCEHSVEERQLREAYINLQSTAIQLEEMIVLKIQQTLERYSNLIDAEARLILKNLSHELQQGILSRKPLEEWDHFVENHPQALLPLKSNVDIDQLRERYSTCLLNNMVTVHAQSRNIKFGYLLSKISNTEGARTQYRKTLFVLTVRFLHEFPINHTTQSHSNVPKYSIPLDSCKISSYSKDKICLTTDTMFCLKNRVERENHTCYRNMLTQTLFKRSSKTSQSNKLIYSTVHTPNDHKKISLRLPDHVSDNEKVLKRWFNALRRLTSFTDVSSRVAYINERIGDIHHAYDKNKDGAGLVRMKDYIINEITSHEDIDEELTDQTIDPLSDDIDQQKDAVEQFNDNSENIDNSLDASSIISTSDSSEYSSSSKEESDADSTEYNLEVTTGNDDLGEKHNCAADKQAEVDKDQVETRTMELNETRQIKLTRSIYS
ncbi:hypothetical protein C6P45_000151 [Maudiozyma exigua]|uniref:PH domain-containing protein n=1 Tax=Maudiozyma exigua TaxID=34358 RepID=A0A9P6W9L1_MAUEX|nr:hypothetical protein C6P45_000151 [Kazachstania exigua]